MEYQFKDALTGSSIESAYPLLDTRIEYGDIDACSSLFFPGCSLINYALPLTSAVYDTLTQHGIVDGISLLCCGKILSYEPDGDEKRAVFERQLIDRLLETDITRIVAACPNCVKALREAFARDGRMDERGMEVVPLPLELARVGYRIDAHIAAQMIRGAADEPALLCVHDSCPDRDFGEFADGLRALLPDGLWVDPAHARNRSLCCGSLPRAAGKIEAADKLALRNGQEAEDVGADAIVTACMSCAFQLTFCQPCVQAVHYLELLYDWRIDWPLTGGLMKLRFLFDEALGAVEGGSSDRSFAALEVSASD